jgi:AraC family transcriptional regulator
MGDRFLLNCFCAFCASLWHIVTLVANDKELVFRPLHQSQIISVHDYCCHIARSGPGAEEESPVNNIVLMRHGAFSRHFGRRTVTADVNQAVFFSRDSTYRVSHPADCGDRGTVFTVSPRVLNDIVRELDPSIDDHPDQPLLFVTGPCDSRVFWRHRELVQRLESAESNPLEPLWADVTALQLVADVLESAFGQRGVARKPKRQGTDIDHAERVEAAKTYLAARMSERIMLDDVARAVHTSPFHLARIFQQQTGVPVHRYLTQLRLRASMERLAETPGDITAVALEFGFSSHSHFTDAFRREFGHPPSEVRHLRTK